MPLFRLAGVALLAVASSHATSIEEPVCADWKDETRDESSVEFLQVGAATRLKKRSRGQFGTMGCPCVGINGVSGHTDVMIGNTTVKYPGDLGASCKAWDNDVHIGSCTGNNNTRDPWCFASWCYVDPCNCNLEVPPVRSSTSLKIPNGLYQAKELFYSYATCDTPEFQKQAGACVNITSETDCNSNADCRWLNSKCGDTFAQDSCATPLDESVTGNKTCLCIGISGKTGNLTFAIGAGGSSVNYSPDTGSACKAWDESSHPSCKVSNPPSWCSSKWCYVDPCSCGIPEPPKTSSYAPDATFQGRKIYYSYATCNAADSWTSSNYAEACVNQMDANACGQLGSKCAWDGSKCMGKELVTMCSTLS